MIKDVLALVFAGAKTSTLGILEEKRTNAAIPFGANYRLIDFSLSNLANSGVRRVGVFTQYRPASLIEHINFGKPWDFVGRSREVRVLPPYTVGKNDSWYKGTADAIYQNIDFIEARKYEHILFLSGEDIYKFDFNELYEYHLSKNADATIVGKYLDYKDLSRFGIIEIDNNFKVVNYEEKPKKPKTNLAYISIAIFKKDILLNAMRQNALNKNSRHSFSGDILPNLIKNKNVYLYENKEPWFYVGNIKEYWETNMKMLDNFKVNPEQWGVRTNIDDRNRCYRKPAFINKSGLVKGSIVTKGCEIKGEVISSILFPGVKVDEGAVVKNSIIMHDCFIKSGCLVEDAVLDKDTILEENVSVGIGENTANKKYRYNYASGITIIGKNVHIPKGVTIGKNCLIYNNDEESFKKKNIPSGTYIKK